MIVIISVAAIVVIGLAVALGLGGLSRLSVQAAEPVTSIGGRALPDGIITSTDIDDLRFDVALRGYRMEQVDAAVAALQRRIAELESQVGGRPAGHAGVAVGSVGSVDTVRPVDVHTFPPAAAEEDRPIARLRGLVPESEGCDTPRDPRP